MEDETQDNLASITYRITSDDQVHIDVEIEDFDTESLESLAKICANLASDQIPYETIKHVRDLLIANDQIALLMPFISKINEHSSVISKLFAVSDKEQSENKEQPCIRPSDMM